LDTNVVLDLWVFRQPTTLALVAGIESGRLRWVASPAMLAELKTVLERPIHARWPQSSERALTFSFESHVTTVADPAVGAASRLHCSDPGDQKFIDLALARPVAALLTRDRALLRLARRARTRGVIVSPPEAWLRESGWA
jgi:predicted nucleic acid-binding protein